MIDRFFGAEAQARIQAAVVEAERRSLGQIVPVVVERSGRYPEARVRGALGGMVLVAAAGVLAERWVPITFAALVAVQLVAAFLGALLARWEPVERLLARGAPMARAVIGGLLSSTLITLVFVPTVYSLFESPAEKKLCTLS